MFPDLFGNLETGIIGQGPFFFQYSEWNRQHAPQRLCFHLRRITIVYKHNIIYNWSDPPLFFNIQDGTDNWHFVTYAMT